MIASCKGSRYVKKTQAQALSAGGLDYGARIVYYTIKRRRKDTHTKRLDTMTIQEIKNNARELLTAAAQHNNEVKGFPSAKASNTANTLMMIYDDLIEQIQVNDQSMWETIVSKIQVDDLSERWDMAIRIEEKLKEIASRG